MLYKDSIKYFLLTITYILSTTTILSILTINIGSLGRIVNMIVLGMLSTYILLVFSHKIIFKNYNINFNDKTLKSCLSFTKIGLLFILFIILLFLFPIEYDSLYKLKQKTLIYNHMEVIYYQKFNNYIKPYAEIIAYVGSIINYLNTVFLAILIVEKLFILHILSLFYKVKKESFLKNEVEYKAKKSHLFLKRIYMKNKYEDFIILVIFLTIPILNKNIFYYPFILILLVLVIMLKTFCEYWKIYQELEKYNPKEKIKEKNEIQLFNNIGD